MIYVLVDIHENLPLMPPEVAGDVFGFDVIPIGGLDFQNGDKIICIFGNEDVHAPTLLTDMVQHGEIDRLFLQRCPALAV